MVGYDRERPWRVVRGDPSRDLSPKRIVNNTILNKHNQLTLCIYCESRNFPLVSRAWSASRKIREHQALTWIRSPEMTTNKRSVPQLAVKLLSL